MIRGGRGFHFVWVMALLFLVQAVQRKDTSEHSTVPHSVPVLEPRPGAG